MKKNILWIFCIFYIALPTQSDAISGLKHEAELLKKSCNSSFLEWINPSKWFDKRRQRAKKYNELLRCYTSYTLQELSTEEIMLLLAIEGWQEKVRFDDVYGQHEAINYFKFMVDYLKDETRYDDQETCPAQVILCDGPSGTGKTFSINAFLEEVNQMLIGTNQIGKFRLIKPSVLRVAMEGFSSLLKDAEIKAPCIVFLDDIDLLAAINEDVFTELVTEIRNIQYWNDGGKNIFIIGTSTCSDELRDVVQQLGQSGKVLTYLPHQDPSLMENSKQALALAVPHFVAQEGVMKLLAHLYFGKEPAEQDIKMFKRLIA